MRATLTITDSELISDIKEVLGFTNNADFKPALRKLLMGRVHNMRVRKDEISRRVVLRQRKNTDSNLVT